MTSKNYSKTVIHSSSCKEMNKMKTSKKGAPRDGLVRHEVARNSIPHHEMSKTHETIEDRWEEVKGEFDDWIEEMKK